jgi:hypothetical protein
MASKRPIYPIDETRFASVDFTDDEISSQHISAFMERRNYTLWQPKTKEEYDEVKKPTCWFFISQFMHDIPPNGSYNDFVQIMYKIFTIQRLKYKLAYSKNNSILERDICDQLNIKLMRDFDVFQKTYPQTSAALDAECQRTHQGAFIFDMPIITNNGYGQKWCNADGPLNQGVEVYHN